MIVRLSNSRYNTTFTSTSLYIRKPGKLLPGLSLIGSFLAVSQRQTKRVQMFTGSSGLLGFLNLFRSGRCVSSLLRLTVVVFHRTFK